MKLLRQIQGILSLQPAYVLTKDWRIFRKSTSLFLMINVILVILITVEHRAESYYDADSSAAPEVEVVSLPEPSLTDFRPPLGELFDGISDRPLFEPSRRPRVHHIEAPPQLEPELAIELIGTLQNEARWKALVKIETHEDAVWVRERGYISSWQVEKISADRIHLRRMGDLRIIELWPKPESRALDQLADSEE